MGKPTCDRHYLHVPAVRCQDETAAEPGAAADEEMTAHPGVFRASLLYIAGDLRQLAQTAPAERREQLLALSVIVASIAD